MDMKKVSKLWPLLVCTGPSFSVLESKRRFFGHLVFICQNKQELRMYILWFGNYVSFSALYQIEERFFRMC